MQESTHACFPFMHFLVYGIGKPLIEHGLVPSSLMNSADRFTGLENRGGRLNPFNAARSLFTSVHRHQYCESFSVRCEVHVSLSVIKNPLARP